jgi:hypothetical protein
VRRRARLAPESLTSLVDVLFILVFAALVQRAAASRAAAVVAPAAKPGTAPPRWQPPPETARLRAVAIMHLTEQLQQQPAVVARVSARGVLTSIELASAPSVGAAGTDPGAAGGDGRAGADPVGAGPPDLAARAGGRVALELPLIERVADVDVAVRYLGDVDPRRRVCAVVASHLGPLAHSLVVIAVEAPLAELMIALAGGLRRDVEACLVEQGAAAVILDSTSLSVTTPLPRESRP